QTQVIIEWIFFFFSSRRRHTRCYRDWSSDVCSSDLEQKIKRAVDRRRAELAAFPLELREQRVGFGRLAGSQDQLENPPADRRQRSEERRVGKECRSGWAQEDEREMKATIEESEASER